MSDFTSSTYTNECYSLKNVNSGQKTCTVLHLTLLTWVTTASTTSPLNGRKTMALYLTGYRTNPLPGWITPAPMLSMVVTAMTKPYLKEREMNKLMTCLCQAFPCRHMNAKWITLLCMLILSWWPKGQNKLPFRSSWQFCTYEKQIFHRCKTFRMTYYIIFKIENPLAK